MEALGFCGRKGAGGRRLKCRRTQGTTSALLQTEWLLSQLYSRTTMLSCHSENMQQAIKHCKAFSYHFNKARKKKKKKKKKVFQTC